MKKRRILVVDDESFIISTVTLILQSRGYEVITASDGGKGLAMARSEHPDLVLLDINMPVMSGHDVCAKLKADRNTKKIPVIMFTGQGERDAIAKALQAGADNYVIKPFTMQTLLAKLNQQFEQSQKTSSISSFWQRILQKFKKT